MAEDTPSSHPLSPMQAAPPVSAWWLAISRQTPAFLLPIGTAFLFLLAWQVIAVYGGISPSDIAATDHDLGAIDTTIFR